MSKQKKRKPNPETQQKLLLAQNRNEYIRKTQWFCSLLGGTQYYKMLEKGIDLIFRSRPKALKVIDGDGKVPEEIITYVKYNLNKYLNKTTAEIYDGGPEISYRDWLFVLLPVQIYWSNYTELRDTDEIIGKIQENLREKFEEIMINIIRKAEYLGLISSDFSDCFFQVRYIFDKTDENGKVRLNNTAIIGTIPPTWRQIRVGAGKRTAARVGWCYYDAIQWMTIQPSQLGIKKVGNNKPMDVYMQLHAINRMRERIDGVYIDEMNKDLINSFFDLKAFPTGGGNFLIEHRVVGMKAGYFAATITDGVLLIRTFLFITHNGTPEGRKLAANTGLGKLDQKYLAFDNLLTLANSDILSNEEVTDIFINAGCSELLDLCRLVRKSKGFWEVSDQEKPLAEKFLNYIKSAKEEISDEVLDFWANEE